MSTAYNNQDGEASQEDKLAAHLEAVRAIGRRCVMKRQIKRRSSVTLRRSGTLWRVAVYTARGMLHSAPMPLGPAIDACRTVRAGLANVQHSRRHTAQTILDALEGGAS